MINIEKDVPIALGSKTLRVALKAMQVGDSFFIDDVSVPVREALFRMMREQKAKGKEFTSSKQNGGVRVWRIA